MKITKIDRTSAREIETAAIAALKEVAERFGLAVAPAGGVIGTENTDVTLRFKFKVTDVVVVADAERTAWNARCRYVGLLETHYLASFTANGEQYVAVAIEPNRHKFPIVGLRVSDGKRFKFQGSMADRISGKSPPPAPAGSTINNLLAALNKGAGR